MEHALILSRKEFLFFSNIILENCGLIIPVAHKKNLENHLNTRLADLNMKSIEEYSNYLLSPVGKSGEFNLMVEMVGKDKTGFFRNKSMFRDLVRDVLPETFHEKKRTGQRRLSALWIGADTGEEPYTLGMVLSELNERAKNISFDFFILATDTSIKSLDHAKMAIYSGEDIIPIPAGFKQRYLLIGKDRRKNLYRIVPELRRKIKFRTMNPFENTNLREAMDLIFLSSSIDYFDKTARECLFLDLINCLNPWGAIYLKRPENIHGLNLPLERTSANYYRVIPS